MQLRKSLLIALMLVLVVYFEIHSCSRDDMLTPEPPVEIPDLLCNANDVFFLDMDRGWIAGQRGTILMTTDGGGEWTPVRVEDTDIRSIIFLNGSEGWIAGSDSRIFKSEDGGSSWERRLFQAFSGTDDFFKVTFFDGEKGFLLSYEGVFVTDDGGMEWANNWLPIVPARGAWNMSMLDDERGYLLGSRWTDADPLLLYSTDDGGINWSGVEGSNASVLRAVLTIEFVDENTGWAGGGVIMKTVDGGASWTTQLETATVREFDFTDANTGFAAGGKSILKTVDGGENWTEAAPDDDRIVDLRGLCFLDSLHGWVVGRGRTEEIGTKLYAWSVLLTTADGGETWDIREFGFEVTDTASEEEQT